MRTQLSEEDRALRGCDSWRTQLSENPTLGSPGSWRRTQCSPHRCCPVCSQPGTPGAAVVGLPRGLGAVPGLSRQPQPQPRPRCRRPDRLCEDEEGEEGDGLALQEHLGASTEPAGISHRELLPSSVLHHPALPTPSAPSAAFFFFLSFPVFLRFFPLFPFLREASEGLGWFCHRHEEPQTSPHSPQIAWKQGRRIPIFFHIFLGQK